MKKTIVILLIAVMLIALLGCSGRQKQSQTAPETREKRTDEPQKNEQPAPQGDRSTAGTDTPRPKDYLQMKRTFDIANHFKEMGYTYKSTKSDGKTSTYILEFVAPEEKTLDGVKAYRIIHKVNTGSETTTVEGWLTEKNTMVDGTINGNPENVPNQAYISTGLSIAPFAFIAMMHSVLSNEQMRVMMGWTVLREGSETINLGFGNTKRTFFEMESKTSKAYIETVNIAGENFIVAYDHADNLAKNEFRITGLVPR